MTLYDRLIRGLFLRRRHAGALGSKDSRRAFLRTAILGGATLPFVPGALERIVLFSGPRSNHELIRLMCSGDYITAQAARDAFAAFVSAPILQVIEGAPIMSDLFTAETYFSDWTITPIGAPIIPLDLTWGAPKPSDLPRSEIESGGIVAPRRRPRDPWDIS